MADKPDPLRPAVLNYEDAARYLGISSGRLRNLKWMGIAPKSISYGRRDVRFRVTDLDAWLDQKAGVALPPEPARKRPKRPRRGLTVWLVPALLGLISLIIWLISLFL
ncbi:helix-turn-helix domain-containing protein [Asaia sp. VD9]|uniref:helix-turn-helix transcriptional regulator n=1 Tax=Asaia sp. VD9 TaxID=3081235 RepID=UPI003019AE5E